MTDIEIYMSEINRRMTDDIVGKTVIFADIAPYNNTKVIVFSDGTFYMAKLESDYYDSYNIANTGCEFHDIIHSYADNIKLTPFGEALGVDFEKCKKLLEDEKNAISEKTKLQRRLQYEELKKEFGNEGN